MTHKEELEKKINKMHDQYIKGGLGKDAFAEMCKLDDEYAKICAEEITQAKKEKDEKSKEMRNRRQRGKYGEKKVAKEVGGRRDGGVGRRDVIGGLFSYEVKTIKEIPASIVKLMIQSERLKKKDTVAVGVFRCNHPRQEFFIVEKQDWVALHGR